MLDAKNVASKVIEISEQFGGVSNLKLQKILYITEGFYQSSSSEKLFNQDFWAWRNGPVIQDVYYKYNENRYHNIPPVKEKNSLGSDIENLLLDIVSSLENKDAMWLSEATHVEPPWLLKYDQSRCIPIEDNLIGKYFSLFNSVDDYLLTANNRLDFRSLGKKRKIYINDLHTLPSGWFNEESIAPTQENLYNSTLVLDALFKETLLNYIKTMPEVLMGPIPSGGFTIEFRQNNNTFIYSKKNDKNATLEVIQGSEYNEYEVGNCDVKNIFNNFIRASFS